MKADASRIKRQASYPSIGVYYLVPDQTKMGWMVFALAERNPDTGEHSGLSEMDLAHSNLYAEVVYYFDSMFGVDISDIGRNCLPRGRISAPETAIPGTLSAHGWKVLHGNDTPTYLRHEVVAEFGLNSVDPEWEHQKFEETDPLAKNELIKKVPFMHRLFEKL